MWKRCQGKLPEHRNFRQDSKGPRHAYVDQWFAQTELLKLQWEIFSISDLKCEFFFVQAMKAYGGVKLYLHLFLFTELRGWEVCLTLRLFYPGRQSPVSMCGSQNWYRPFGEEKNFLPEQETETRLLWYPVRRLVSAQSCSSADWKLQVELIRQFFYEVIAGKFQRAALSNS